MRSNDLPQPAYGTRELATLMGVSVQRVHALAKAEAWQSRPRKGRGGGHEWLVSSMPADSSARLAITRAAAQTSAPALSGEQAVIPDWANSIALARYRLVHELRQAVRRNPKKRKLDVLEGFLSAYHAGLLLPELRERLGDVSMQTLYRWDKQLRESGDDYRALADRRGKWDKGGAQGLGQIGQEAEQALLQCWLQPNQPSVSLAYRAMAAILEREGRPVPSEVSCRRFLRRYATEHQDIVVLRRQGEKALKDKVGPFITRADKILDVGDVLFADGHDLNFEVLHPETGKPHRPTLIVWFDWRSRMPVGWEIMPTESAVAIASALRMAIAALGKHPGIAYIDNGRAFKAKYFTQSESELRELDGLYARLGIALQFSRPYEARTKIIERWFGTFNEQCARLLPSYCGRSIDDKPAWRRRNETYHQARRSEWIPTIREAAEIVRLYVGWYGQQPHKGLGGRTPVEVFAAGRGAGVDTAELDRHFLWTRKVRPGRCGFTLAGMRYESDCLYGLSKDILVKFSWADLSRVHLFDLDGTPIGQAAPTQAIHPLARHFGDELDLLKVKEANKRQRQLKQQTLHLARELDVPLQDSGLSELPWMRRDKQPLRSVPKPKAKADPAGLTPERRAELEAMSKAIGAATSAANARPAYSAPEYFPSAIERYDFLFGVSVKQGLALTSEDAAWMADFEASDEFQRIAGDSYARLRAIYFNRTEEARS